MNKKILIIYHRVDFDGLFSAMIYHQKITTELPYTTVELFGYNYGDEVPSINLINQFDKIIILDISFDPEYMNRIDKDKLVWIDHHITAIRDSKIHGYDNLNGVRCEDNSKSACELTWEFCYPKEDGYEKPIIIEFISAHDVWNKNRYDWNDYILPIQHGLRSFLGSMNINKLIEQRDNILNNSFVELNIIPGGRMINNYLRMKWKTQVKNSAFDITVAGKLKGIALLSPDFTSAAFESILNKGYQVFCICNPKKENQDLFSVSLYSEPDGRLGNFELGEYMKENYNGGGHATSAGGKLNKEQFERLLFNKQI